jgi:AcrR family transcriptional regulator
MGTAGKGTKAGDKAPPRGGKRERNKAENREAILAAARRVFAELGYEAATIRDVIGATELAAGTFYNYFPDKESVLRALLEVKMGELQKRAHEARLGAATVEDIVRSTLAVSFSVVAEDREVFDLLRRNAGAIRAILDEPSFVANRDDLRRDLQRAMRRSGSPVIDAEYLTAAISGLAFEVAACAADRQPPRMDAAAEFATALVLGGIAALKPAAASRAKTTAKSPRTTSAAPRSPRKGATAQATARRGTR